MKNASNHGGTSGLVFQTSLVVALLGFGTYFDHVISRETAVSESLALAQDTLAPECVSVVSEPVRAEPWTHEVPNDPLQPTETVGACAGLLDAGPKAGLAPQVLALQELFKVDDFEQWLEINFPQWRAAARSPS